MCFPQIFRWSFSWNVLTNTNIVLVLLWITREKLNLSLRILKQTWVMWEFGVMSRNPWKSTQSTNTLELVMVLGSKNTAVDLTNEHHKNNPFSSRPTSDLIWSPVSWSISMKSTRPVHVRCIWNWYLHQPCETMRFLTTASQFHEKSMDFTPCRRRRPSALSSWQLHKRSRVLWTSAQMSFGLTTSHG